MCVNTLIRFDEPLVENREGERAQKNARGRQFIWFLFLSVAYGRDRLSLVQGPINVAPTSPPRPAYDS